MSLSRGLVTIPISLLDLGFEVGHSWVLFDVSAPPVKLSEGGTQSSSPQLPPLQALNCFAIAEPSAA